VKSIAGFICFVSLFCSAAYGEIRLFNKPYALSLAAQAGIVYGTAYEIVYPNEQSNEYLSELQWELKPLFVMGLNFSLEPVQSWGFFTRFNIKAGFPADSGTMEDRDWLDFSAPGKLTNFSSHTNKTQATVLLALDAGFSFPVTEWFFLRPFVSFDYIFFKMEGRDGYSSYASTGWEIKPVSGPVIRYSQNWFLLSPGVSLGFMLNRFTIMGNIKITPFIYCIGTDDHLAVGKTITYTDYMKGKLAVEPSLDVSFAISPRFTVGLNSSYRFITGSRGDTFQDDHGNSNSTSWYLNSGGAGLRLWESALYLRVFLGKR